MSLEHHLWAWNHRLPPVEKLLLLYFVERGEHWTHLDVAQCANFCGVGDDEARIAIDFLVGCGLLERMNRMHMVRVVYPVIESTLLAPKPGVIGKLYLKPECVYFARSNGLVKIGTSRDPIKRVKALSNGWPSEISLMLAVPGGREVERGYHEQFVHLQAFGEWFHARPELIEFIESLRPSGIAA